MASQTAKTDGVQMNLIGHRLDDDPAPILYIGPTKSFVEKVIEPRLMSMIRSSASLKNKYSAGHSSTKTQKIIGGVKVRLAWAGSPTELAGDPAALVQVDEYDRMDSDVGGEGDVKELADARHSTYPDGTTVVTSTPLIGSVETEIDPVSGLEHWAVPADPEEIQSPTWKLWNEGTRHEWAWPCPECDKFFVPRFKLLHWPEKATPAQALRSTRLQCPHCKALLEDKQKQQMNARADFAAPGQWFDENGKIQGSPPDSDTASFWVSGLCSPWRSWGQRAAAFIKAVASGSSERIQGVINTGFGELFRVSGEVPLWTEVQSHAISYKFGEVPNGVQALTMGVDVQKDRLEYVVRGWGAGESWLIDVGEIIGETETENKGAWIELERFKNARFGRGFYISRCFVDSGYRTNEVYIFCAKHKGWAYACKGQDTQVKPISVNTVDVKVNGKVFTNGVQLWNLHADFFKTWVHDQVNKEISTWHLPSDVTEDYCKQIVSEAKVAKPSGRTVWVKLKKANHKLDAEYMARAAAFSLHVDKLQPLPVQGTTNNNQPAAAQPAQRGRRMRSKGLR